MFKRTLAATGVLSLAMVGFAVPTSVQAASGTSAGDSPSSQALTPRKKNPHCDYWHGKWDYRSEASQEDGTYNEGYMDLGVYEVHEKVSGAFYENGVKGKISGYLYNKSGTTVKPCGKLWVGTFKKPDGTKGSFVATLEKGPSGYWAFYGSYKPSKNWVTSYIWYGNERTY